MHLIRSPLQVQIVQWLVQPGDLVQADALLVVLEAMKMEHELRSPCAGRVSALLRETGDLVAEGEVLLNIEQTIQVGQGLEAENVQIFSASPPSPPSLSTHGPSAVRPDLLRLQQRQALTLDASRPEAMAKRHALGLRSARENIADLCDPGSFVEYGALAVAAQRSRRSEDDLVRNTPADGMVTGIGSINQAQFGPDAARAVVMAYDATVLAGTQGMRNHQKTDRLLGLALQQQLPVVLFAEGGGGRHAGGVSRPAAALQRAQPVPTVAPRLHPSRDRRAGHVCGAQLAATRWPPAATRLCLISALASYYWLELVIRCLFTRQLVLGVVLLKDKPPL